MRIVCVTNYSDRPEAETFIGLNRAGVQITVMCPSNAPYYQRLIDAGVSVLPLKISGRFDYKAIAAIRRTIIDTDTDLLHLFNNRAVQNGIIAARGLPVKIVVYRGIVGNVSFFDPASWMTYLHPRVDRIICVCEAIRKYFLQMNFLGLKLSEDKPVTIYKGHSLDWYRDSPGDLGQFGIPADAFVVGCTANFRPRKGIRFLIDAMRHLPESAPIHLLLIGNMESRQLRRQIQNSPCSDRIHLAGYRPDAPALQAACQTAVLPSLKREGLPKVVIEAMAYGIPPIVTDAGGSPELIENGISGIVVPPGRPNRIAQAIMRLYNHPAELEAMGQKARQRIAACFPIEATIEQTLRVYEGCLKTSD